MPHASATAPIQSGPGAPQHSDPRSRNSGVWSALVQPRGSSTTKQSPCPFVLAPDQPLSLRRAGNAARGPSPGPSGSPDRVLPAVGDLIVRELEGLVATTSRAT